VSVYGETLAFWVNVVQNCADSRNSPYKETAVASNVVAFFETYRSFFEGLAIFGGVFLLTGTIAGVLLRRIVYAWDPSSKRVPSEQQETPARIAIACFNVVAWMLALICATEVVDLPSIASFFVYLVATILLAPAAIVFASLIVYSFSKEGNQLVSGLIGFVYLQLNKGKRRTDRREFDLGDGLLGVAERVSLLQSTFKLTDGREEKKSNALLMKQWFGLGKRME
jgi:hypothetical protein